MKLNIIIEPEGVVFHVINKPLTTQQEKMLHEAIQKSKAEEAKKQIQGLRR